MHSTDLGVWIQDGLETLENLSFVRTDIYTVHKNLNFIYPARLSNILMALIYKVFGYAGIVIFLRGLLLASFSYLFHQFNKRYELNLFNFLVLITIGIGISIFFERPAIFGILFFILSFDYLSKVNNPKSLALLFFIFILWGNLHSSILIFVPVLGWNLLSQFYLNKKTKWPLLIIIIFIISLIINPEGIQIFQYALNTVSASKFRMIEEWKSPFMLRGELLSFGVLYLLSLVSFFFYVWRNKKLKEVALSPLFPLLFLGLSSIRNSIWFYLSVFFYFREFGLWKSYQSQRFQNVWVNKLVILFLVLLIFWSSPFVHFKKTNKSYYHVEAPVKLISRLKQREDLRILNSLAAGSYLILNQKNKIFIDTRNIIFSDEIFKDYFNLLNCELECDDLLNKYDLNAVLLEKTKDWKIVKFLSLDNQWKVEFQDNDFIFLIKN